ncbi:MAG: ATPase [Clostridia bacterium]|nr:ATPase [Clostridia bacterium]
MPNNQATMEDLLDELLDLFDKGFKLPLTGGKSFVDTDEASQIIEEIRELIPEEVRKAQAMLADRERIIADARNEAESLITNARAEAEAVVNLANQKAETLVNQEEIVRIAQAKAAELEKKGQEEYKNRINASYDYVEEFLRQTDAAYTENLEDLRKVRQNIKENRHREIGNLG